MIVTPTYLYYSHSYNNHLSSFQRTNKAKSLNHHCLLLSNLYCLSPNWPRSLWFHASMVKDLRTPNSSISCGMFALDEIENFSMEKRRVWTSFEIYFASLFLVSYARLPCNYYYLLYFASLSLIKLHILQRNHSYHKNNVTIMI